MQNFVRLLLLLGIVGSAVTMVGSAAAWWLEEQRRLTRLAGRVLGGPVDSVIVARGRNAAAAFRRSADKMLVMYEGGAKAVLYPLALLVGAELVVDDRTVGRAARDETRRPLEQISADARKVVLRLIFDDAAHPEFMLELWLPKDQLRHNPTTPAAVIVEARTWLARIEALVREAAAPARSGNGRSAVYFEPIPPPPAEANPPTPPPWEDEGDSQDHDAPSDAPEQPSLI